MAAGFDPYHKWLGIPPEEQPPNHYRLLGLRLFEADPEVIEAASDQRMAHLRTHQAGQYSALSQRLLNEVAAAKICLISPERRARYDESLRAATAARIAATAPPTPAVPRPPAIAPSPPSPPSRPPSPLPPPVDLSQSEPMAPPAFGERSFDLQSLGVTDEEDDGESSPASSGIGRRQEAPAAADLPPSRAAKPGRKILIAALALCAVLLGVVTAMIYVAHRRQHAASPGERGNATTPPALLDPADKATLPNPDPPTGIALRWQPVVNASRYWVRVELGGRAKPLVDKQDHVETSILIQLAHPVPRHSLHGWRWRVRSLVNGQWTDWSETRGFDLAEPAGHVPAGQAPAGQLSPGPKPVEGPQAQQPSLPVEPEKPEMEKPAEVEKPAAVEKPIERRPLPAEAARRQANHVFHDAYKRQYEAARKVEERLALADDMLHKAETADDPAAQFVLMERARAISANAGDTAKALDIVAQIAERFEVDSLAMRVETLTDSLQSDAAPADRNFDMGEKVLEAMEQLGHAQKYDAAIALGAVYRDHARRPVNAALMRRVTAEIKALHERQAGRK